jgi:N-acetylmuramate 1-kinase
LDPFRAGFAAGSLLGMPRPPAPVQHPTSSVEVALDSTWQSWLTSVGLPPVAAVPLAGDVSPRRYYRLVGAGDSALLLAHYDPSVRASGERFLVTTHLLTATQVRVPAVTAWEPELGLMLIEDLGPRTLYEQDDDSWAALEPWFVQAVELTQRIAALSPEAVAGLSPPLDRALLERELEQTWRLFLAPQGLLGDARDQADLETALSALCAALGEAPVAVCHRDFMARNLVPLAGRQPGSPDALGVLDHQDLRLGPATYDLASLLNDSLFPPPALEERLLDLALGAGAPRLDYHRAAAQRALKAVGTFAAFAARGNAKHLPLIPQTLTRALDHLHQLPEGGDLAPRLRRNWASHLLLH